LKNSLWNGGTGELVDVSNGTYHWMYRSAGEHVARELLTDCYILKYDLLATGGSTIKAIHSYVDDCIPFHSIGSVR